MSGPRLLIKLLDYVLEQDKEVDPRGFKLSQHKGFIKAKPDLQGLPGVDFDIKIEGDHIWMRVARLEAARPPALSDERLKGLIVISDDPNGPVPRIDEVAFKHRLTPKLQQRIPEERPAYEAQARESLNRALADYTPLWTAWAEGEKPRRRTISLYGDLFALNHQLQSEETAKPHELVWGIGVSSWKLSYAERTGSTVIDFQYPLLTQAVELALEEKTLAIDVRPRASTRASSSTRSRPVSYPVQPMSRRRPGKRWLEVPTARSTRLTRAASSICSSSLRATCTKRGGSRRVPIPSHPQART